MGRRVEGGGPVLLKSTSTLSQSGASLQCSGLPRDVSALKLPVLTKVLPGFPQYLQLMLAIAGRVKVVRFLSDVLLSAISCDWSVL